MWDELRARRFNGMKFVRQSPIGPFFVDFTCREARIIVEAYENIDGVLETLLAFIHEEVS